MEATSADVQRDFGSYRKAAAGIGRPPEPVTVLHQDEPSVVIVAAAEYERLKRRDKQVMATEDVPEWMIKCVAAGEMDPRFAHLDEPT